VTGGAGTDALASSVGVLRFGPLMATGEAAIDAHDSDREIAFRSSAARPGAIGLVLQGWAEIWSRRRLIGYLARADLKKKGADTFFGNLWWIIDPLLQMTVYVVLVDFIFHKSVPDYPLFIFCAILPWKWFTSSTYDAVTAVVGQERLIKQIHFPKIILPVASTTAAVANFLFGLIPLFALLLLFFRDRATCHVVWIPYVAFVQFMFTLAFCVAVSAVNVFFRDIGNVVRHFMRLWFYLSPGLYALDQLQEQMAKNQLISAAVNLNPWTWIFESYRRLIYYGQDPYWFKLLAVLAFSVAFLAFSTYLFKRVEPAFAKVL
jgi:ABC-type polysaccharide/polyol phosphate export permease